jgi:hypothetical protein
MRANAAAAAGETGIGKKQKARQVCGKKKVAPIGTNHKKKKKSELERARE